MAEPYYAEDGITIYHGDCREIIPALNLGAHVTITDPPYGQTSLAWDRWVDGWPRIIPGDEMWVFGSMRMFMDHAAEFDGWRFGQDLVWEKHNGSNFHADRFRRVHESVVHFYRGDWEHLKKSVPRTMDATKRTVRRKERPPHMGEIESSSYRSEDGGPRLMRSVLSVRSCHGDAVHPTQKPLGTVYPLIEYSTAQGWDVFDPFMGSGSTLIAARALDRNAIGIEADEQYCEAAVRRLAQGVLDLDATYRQSQSAET